MNGSIGALGGLAIHKCDADSRLDRLAEGVQEILNLAGVRTDLIEDIAILPFTGTTSIRCRSSVEAIARSMALRHDSYFSLCLNIPSLLARRLIRRGARYCRLRPT